ncbi:prtrc system protein e [Epilithonimonas sp. JDS]|jgi:PRTRC genetic system protein E|uniref:prtrc system protein e n=1 Tax=Epilithonimonas sp. JDS TaxID=2902797 RepID=UPI001E4975EF|nr:prtrc system protein e [Epilithonimonas sp. JDS]MCD9855613.1 prtrc system protein e [Epilithonimonas sp. JDS]
MKTNFFSLINQIEFTGNLNISIQKATDNNWIVSVLLLNSQCGDEAKNRIPPLNLRGTSEDLDNGFFENITQPIQSASYLMVNMDSFMVQLEEAKKHSAMEKQNADKEKKAKDERDKKYRDAMKKAEELENDSKFKDAWSALPKASDYPEYSKEILEKQEIYEKEFAPNLFTS